MLYLFISLVDVEHILKGLYCFLKKMSHRIRALNKTSTISFKRWIYWKRKALIKTYLTSKFFQNWKVGKSIRAQKVHARLYSVFLYCSIIITELLSTSLQSQFQPVSEMGKSHALAMNFKGWPFGVIVKRHFRSKVGHLNERVYCKLIDRTSKVLFIKESGSFLRPTVLSYGSQWLLDKKNINVRRLWKHFL